MKVSDQSQNRARLWQAFGNQPGVSAWFAVWSLSRSRSGCSAHSRESIVEFSGGAGKELPCPNTR